MLQSKVPQDTDTSLHLVQSGQKVIQVFASQSSSRCCA